MISVDECLLFDVKVRREVRIPFWELEMLAEAGRLRLGTTIAEARDVVLRTNVTEVPIDAIAMTAAHLRMHGDPGDSFIVATALPLMTADEKIRSMKSLRTVDPTR